MSENTETAVDPEVLEPTEAQLRELLAYGEVFRQLLTFSSFSMFVNSFFHIESVNDDEKQEITFNVRELSDAEKFIRVRKAAEEAQQPKIVTATEQDLAVMTKGLPRA